MINCKLCSKNYNDVGTFNKHIKLCLQRVILSEKKNVKINACPVCNEESDTLYQNYAHLIENHQNFLENRLKCQKCGKKYKLKSNLQKHLKECTTNSFVCGICGAVKYSQKHYLQHMDQKHNRSDRPSYNTSNFNIIHFQGITINSA